MIQVTPQMRILVAIEPADFRNHPEYRIIPSKGVRCAVYCCSRVDHGCLVSSLST